MAGIIGVCLERFKSYDQTIGCHGIDGKQSRCNMALIIRHMYIFKSQLQNWVGQWYRQMKAFSLVSYNVRFLSITVWKVIHQKKR